MLRVVWELEGDCSRSTTLRVLHLCTGGVACHGVFAGSHVGDLVMTLDVDVCFLVACKLQMSNRKLLLFAARDAWGILLLLADGSCDAFTLC